MQIFSNAEFGSVRVVEKDNEPWFVGKDVTEILGYSNSKDALAKHVEEEDKGILKSSDLRPLENHIPKEILPVNFCYGDIPNRGLTIINESGLYSLILGSKLPKAKSFKHWITSEVLPAIRKHGVFVMDDIISNTDALIEALQAFKAEREQRKKLETENAIQKQQLIEMQPKATYYDIVLNCKELVPISVIAKDYGWSANRMNQFLHEKGVQYKQNGKIWLLYQKYADKGYTSTKTCHYNDADGTDHVNVHTYWTQSGRCFLYGLLKSNGVLPLIERNVG